MCPFTAQQKLNYNLGNIPLVPGSNYRNISKLDLQTQHVCIVCYVPNL